MTQKYQGDVSLIKIETIAGIEFKTLPKEGVIVAYGEVTGHTHTIVKEKEATVEFGQDTKGYYFKVSNGNAVIKHQEHAPITLEPGIWFVGKQWEYNELEDRRVAD